MFRNMTGYLHRIKESASQLMQELHALHLAYKDPRVPWKAKVLCAAVVGYALSPLDLIPDFIPVLGYLDDLILLPFGIWLALKMIPPQVVAECRQKARALPAGRGPIWLLGAGIVIILWGILAAGVMGIIFWLKEMP